MINPCTSFSLSSALFNVSITNLLSLFLDILYAITCLSYKSIIIDKYALLPLKIKYDFSRLITNTFISVCMTYNLNTYQQYYIYRSDIYKIIYSLVLATAAANIARFIYNLVCDLKLSKDVLKYHEFFEMKDEIDKYGDVLLNENISLKEVLNINTLDFYSISRVKEILETVKENYNKEKTLIKK